MALDQIRALQAVLKHIATEVTHEFEPEEPRSIRFHCRELERLHQRLKVGVSTLFAADCTHPAWKESIEALGSLYILGTGAGRKQRGSVKHARQLLREIRVLRRQLDAIQKILVVAARESP